MRYIFLVAGIFFVIYTIHCIRSQNFWKGLRQTWNTVWGRQFLVDLNIGFLMWGFLYYLNEGSTLIAVGFTALTILFGNIFPLFYVFFNYSELVARFNLL